ATLDDQERAQSLIEASVAQVTSRHEVKIEVHGQFARPPRPVTPAMETLYGIVKRAGADLGQSIDWQPTGGVCDGNNIAACGVPVIDTMGVRGGKLHSIEEYLIVDSLHERAALSALTLCRLAGEAA
ncbi:MAG: hydrolase, partial [Sphingomicrobium sp.]